ncbi:MAG: lysophospholipase [Candidatus Aminicenantes bacterium]|nr:lysophospholipase [Candidatus Aminicenantes bacterium]
MRDDSVKISSNSELFRTFDETQLFEQSFTPEADPHGVIIIVHGLTEHSGCYINVSRIIAGQNYAVSLFDIRGHGKSDGPPVLIDSFDDYLDDLSVFFNLVKKRFPKKPVFLLGQGMGAVISALYFIEKKPEIRGLILSAPVLSIREVTPWFLRKIFWAFGILFPRWPLVKINPDYLSNDLKVLQDFDRDPLVYQGKIYARTYLEMIRASEAVKGRCNEIEIPVLILHGREDKITGFEASQEMHAQISSTDKTFKLYKGLSHLLLLEAEDKPVVKDIIRWTDSHVRTS